MNTVVREPSAKYLVQAAFHQTEAGFIPAHWASVRLADVAQVRGGVAKNANVAITDPIEVAYLRVANVQDGYLDLADVSTILISKADLKRYSLIPDDVLMNEGGDLDKLGRGAVWRGQVVQCVHQNHVFAVRCGPQLNSEYLNVWTGSASARRFFLLAGKQTTNLASISKSSLGEMPIALPQPEEQRAIATALSGADALIAGLERLIAKKRDIKQATMQQLLTGQTRLPGFKEKWETKRLGEVGEISSAGVDKKLRQDEEPVRLVNYLDVYHRDFIFSHDLDHWVTAPPHQLRRCAVRAGDVFFTPTSETRNDIGRSAVAMEDIPDAAYSYHVARLRLHEPWDLRFRAYAFKTKTFLDQAEKLCDGNGTRYVISQGKFRSMVVRVPRIEEQAAIATVLSDMDADLSALESRLAKTRAIKQGMMQELLTGRTRLV